MGDGNQELTQGDAAANIDTTESGRDSDGKAKTGRKPRKTEIKEEFLGLADVEVPEPAPAKKKRGRKAKENPKDTATIETMVKAVYGIAATRFGPVWEVSDDEAKSIAGPLASILARYEKLIMVSQYSDMAMLLLAVGGVTIPRLVVTVQARKEAKKSERPATESHGENASANPGHVPGGIKGNLPSLSGEPL